MGVIQFDSLNGEVIGFYNRAANSLIICDATHHDGPQAVQALGLFVDVVEKYKGETPTKFRLWMEKWVDEVHWPDWLMGADPEFEIATADGEILSACTVFPGGGVRSNKKFGYDGEADIGEIRPNPKSCPLELTQEIKRLLKKITKDPKFPSDGQMWVGGGMKLIIGGHIHISGVDATDELLDILGMYIAHPMHKSMNIDGGANRQHDRHSGWTKETNRERIRGSDDGDPNHWEWRPLMAYHFDEATTNAVHCLFYCVIETWRRNRKNLKKDLINDTVEIEDYEKLEFYGKYKTHIDAFIEKFVKGVQKMEGIDVLDNWFKGRPKEKKITFICLYMKPGAGTGQGKCYTGQVPNEVALILDDLRNRPFPNLDKSFRCSVTHYNGSGIRYAGINDEGAKIVQDVVDDKMIGADYSADILSDHYRGKAMDFSFWLPELSYKTEKNRKILADMIYKALMVTLKANGNVT